MSSDKIKNIEDKVRELGEKSNVKGAEEQLEAYNKIQNQLININSERASNLQAEKIYSTLENQNNQNIAQLSELVTSPQQTIVPQQIAQLSPGTLDILGKYGYKQPVKQYNRTQNTQVTPDKIIINNNTENITTNNVQVPPPQSAVNPQSVVQKNDNTDKFKVWLSNEFARQKEQAAIREREFEKKEWSLNRSNSKLMTYLEELGKGFAENLNPQRIGNIFGDQLKTLYFLLGFQYIANNWEKILNGVASVENWIKEQAAYFGIGEAGKKLSNDGGGFVNDLKVFLGGEKNQSLKNVFLGLFESGVDMLMERLKLFFQDRADAIKSVKFPDLWASYKSDGIMGALKGIGLYLGDILSCLMSGRSGLSNAIKTGMERSSDSSHIGKKDGIHKGKISANDDSGIKNTSLGDASISVRGNDSQDWLEKGDMTKDGKLSNNMASSVRQSNSVGSYLKEADTSTVHTGSVMSGLENLKVSAKDYGKTLVGEDFFRTLSRELEIDLSDLRSKVPTGKYKYVKVKKTDKELKEEGVLNPLEAGITKGIERSLRNKAQDSLGIFGDVISLTDEDIIENPIWQGAVAAGKAQFAKWTTDTNKLQLVPESDPRPAEEIEVKSGSYYDDKTGVTRYTGKQKKSLFSFYELTPEIIDAIEKKLSEKLNYEDFKFGFKDSESLKRLNNLLIERKRKKLNSKLRSLKEGTSDYELVKENINSLKSDIDIESYDKTLDDLDRRREERHREYKETFNKSQFGKFTENVKEEAIEIYDRVNSLFNEAIGKPHVVFGNNREFVKTMIPAYEKILQDKGIDKEFAKYLVAQDALESAWGKSVSGDYNFGGIKVDSKEKGRGKKVKTKEWRNGKYEDVVDEFKNFNSPEDYAEYHINFLNRNRYRSFDGGIDEFINRTVSGGYATDPKYSSKLQNVVESIKLTLDDIKEEDTLKYTPKHPMSLPENNIYLTRGEDLEKYPGFENIDDTANYVTENINIPELKPRIGESFFGIGLNEDGSENTSYTPIVSNIPLKPTNLSTNISEYVIPTLSETNFTNTKLTEMAENIKLQTEALIVYGENLQNLAVAVSSSTGGQNITINNSPVPKPQAPSYTSTPGGFGNNNIGD